MNLIIKESKVGGNGSFAPFDIKRGTQIIRFEGERVSKEEIDRRIDNTKEENEDDPLQIGDRDFLDLSGNAYFINHSCTPNSAFTGEVNLIAIKNIKKGEEITFDYSSTVGKDINWWMNCKCGSKNCRKRIGNVLTIPKDQIMSYFKAGGLQDYIRKQLGLS